MDKDIAALSQRLEATPADSPQARVATIIQEVLGRPHRWTSEAKHKAAKHFRAGEPLEIAISVAHPNTSIRLYYRHVDQAERYTTVLMTPVGQQHRVTIPATYTNSEYPLEYYFEIRDGKTRVDLFPGFSSTLTNQPYFVVRRA
jgi:hypothetical protein